MSRIGQYLIEHGPVDIPPTVGDGGSVDVDKLRMALELTPQDVQELLDLSAGLESLPEFPQLELPADELIPSIGTEDFRERAIRVWEAIKRWIRNLVRWLDQSFDTANANLRVTKFMIQQAQHDMRSLSQRQTGERSARLVLTKHVNTLSVRYQPLEDMGKINGALTVFHKHAMAYYDYVNTTFKGGLNTALSQLAVGHAKDPGLIETMLKISPNQVARAMDLRPIQGRDQLLGSVQLMGNMRFTLTQPLNEIIRITQLPGIKLALQHAELTPRELPDTIEIPRFDRQTMERTLKQLLGIVSDLENIVRGDIAKKHRQSINDIVAMGDRFRLDSRLNTAGEDDLRQRLQLTQTMITWMTEPYRALVTHSLRNVRATLALCNLNLK